MDYTLKEKIEVTKEFLENLITKSWQESEALKHQIVNIDTSTNLGAGLVKILKTACTNNYVLIGCLENLLEYPDADVNELQDICHTQKDAEPETTTEPTAHKREELLVNETHIISKADFEPFEYFVDFDEPVGNPITDEDLYKV